MTVLTHSAPGNRLLAALPARSRQEFIASCGYVELEFAEVWCEPSKSICHGYFQVASFISRVNRNFNKKSAELRQYLNSYIYVLLRQLALSCAGGHFPIIEARLARWLLMPCDWAHSNQFHITHKFLTYMLGVCPVGITEAATALHARGLSNYRRGDIVLTDRADLNQTACDCYRMENDIYDELPGSKPVTLRGDLTQKARR